MFSAGELSKNLTSLKRVIEEGLCKPEIMTGSGNLQVECDKFIEKVIEKGKEFPADSKAEDAYVETIAFGVTYLRAHLKGQSDPRAGAIAALKDGNVSSYALEKPFTDAKQNEYETADKFIEGAVAAGYGANTDYIRLPFGGRLMPSNLYLTIGSRSDETKPFLPTFAGGGSVDISWLFLDEQLTITPLSISLEGSYGAAKQFLPPAQETSIALVALDDPFDDKGGRKASFAGDLSISAALRYIFWKEKAQKETVNEFEVDAGILSATLGILDIRYGKGVSLDVVTDGFGRVGSGKGFGLTVGSAFDFLKLGGSLAGGVATKTYALDLLAIGNPSEEAALVDFGGFGGGFAVGAWFAPLARDDFFKKKLLTLNLQYDLNTSSITPEDQPTTSVLNHNLESWIKIQPDDDWMIAPLYRLSFIDSREGFIQHVAGLAVAYDWFKATLTVGDKSGVVELGPDPDAPGSSLSNLQNPGSRIRHEVAQTGVSLNLAARWKNISNSMWTARFSVMPYLAGDGFSGMDFGLITALRVIGNDPTPGPY
ncbi:MAG: hypothetical protein A3I05_00265 [Deltaproteobacteria bacterium RIFCSPLOWO2_02_FULL_44_10]|nr:MAG: hypothetical protein A3C46_01130 [Deltaproteobacteria bacterium RIFCSPHIGHO2_02_FULL_44_16]OGQ47240.1 MAG: hypothetical protein A3I05_00265 [Deltaproteobacteria bacterium RIFCSPLOWO2_02_FULL_44_10]